MRIPWLLALLAAGPMAAAQGTTNDLPRFPVPGAHDRVLIIAPHPDDETLCCAGLLLQAAGRGASVGIVWVTAGDGFELDAMLVQRTLWPGSAGMLKLGTQRLSEARSAADELQVPRASQYVLGYPDRGVQSLTLQAFYRTPFRSSYTQRSSVPYPLALDPGAAYTGADLERDLARVLDDFKPTLVLAAAPEDRNPDHLASSALVRRLLEQRSQLGSLRYWIVHAPGWPRPWGLNPGRALIPPPIAAARHWQSLPLSDAERVRKLAALRAHVSQMQCIAPFLKAFVRANEIFAPGP